MLKKEIKIKKPNVFKKKQVITRFAPSPTGGLHIGGARTALFNYLFAKKNNGQFIFRIENTDIERNIEEKEKEFFEDLIWMGIIPDKHLFKTEFKEKEQIYYIQKQRIPIYLRFLNQLLKEKKAYYCFCSEKELEEEKKNQYEKTKSYKYSKKCLKLNVDEVEEKLKIKKNYVVRFLVDQNKKYSFLDLIRGNILCDGFDIEDFVIFRNNGFPLYNFAVVIDDHLMDVTHIIRGEEHLTNTHKQIALYRAFNWKIPEFIHLPLILNKEKKNV